MTPHRASKEARQCRIERLSRFDSMYASEASKREVEEVKKIDKEKMKNVIDFFYAEYPGVVPEVVSVAIRKLMARRGTSSILGTINALDRVCDWEEWRPIALEHFNIKL